jgi:hypothetical protein
MRFLSAIFFGPKRDAAVDAADGNGAVNDGEDARAHGRLKLPQRRHDVEDWEPPIPGHVPAREQAQALVALFQSEGRFGAIPHWEIEASYGECAWINGYIQVTKLQLCRALGAVCTKVRRDVLSEDGEVIRAAHYVIPEPYVANVVPIGNKRPAAASKYGSSQPRPSRTGTRNKAQHKSKSAGGKARFHRADIAEAVACQR